MSQEKVELYKKEKKNRKKNLKKDKRNKVLIKITSALIGILLIAGLVWIVKDGEIKRLNQEPTSTMSQEELSSLIDSLNQSTSESETTTANGETTTANGETTAANSETTTANSETTAANSETTTAAN